MSESQNFSGLSNPEVITGLKSLSSESQLPSEAPKPRTERKWQWAYPQIEGIPPTPRGGHTATLVDRLLVVFGGHYFAGKGNGYMYLNDTVTLDVDENRWARPRTNGTPPLARYGHSAVLAGSRIVIFGGRGAGSAHLRDLHALDSVSMTWYQGPEGGNGPSGRLSHSANLIGSRMFVFGGWDSELFFNDLFVLDLGSMAWTEPETAGPSPVPRMGHVSTVVGHNLVIQGGFHFSEEQHKKCGLAMGSMLKECYLNDLRVLDTETMTWSRLRVSGAPPRHCYMHSIDASGADLVVLGGYGAFQKATEKDCEYFTVLNTDNMSWERPSYNGTPPAPRHGHTTAVIGAHVLVFGGWEASKAMNDVVVLRDLSSMSSSK